MMCKKMAKIKNPDPENPHEFVDKCDTEDVHQLLTALLPIIKLDNGGKYMIGTLKHTIQIKSDRLFIRVGGGYATLEEYLKQNAPFECIKIAKVMRDKQCNYKDAVTFYLEKHKAAKNVMKEWLKGDDNNTALFDKTIQKMRDLQDEKNNQYKEEAAARRAAKAEGKPNNLELS